MDIGVQSHVETREVVTALCSLAKRVAHREVIVSHLITTLHIDTVVRHKGITVNLLCPVGIIMIGLIIIIAGIGIDKLHALYIRGESAQQLSCIEAIVLCTHHLWQTGLEHKLTVDIHINLGSHRLIALGLDEQDATSCLGTIDSRTVLQHGDTLNISNAQVGQQVIIVTGMQHLTVVLHVCDDTINHNQGLGICLKTGQTIHKHGITNTQLATAANRMDISTQLLCHQGVDAYLSRILETFGTTTGYRCCRTLIDRTERIRIKLCVGLFRIGTDSFLQDLIALNTHTDTAHVLGHLQLIGTSLISHGSKTMVTIGFNDDTGQRLARGSIHHITAHLLHLLSCHCQGQKDKEARRQNTFYYTFYIIIDYCFHIRSIFTFYSSLFIFLGRR